MNDPEVLKLFGRQFGVATGQQLRSVGVSPRAIARAQERGAWLRISPGLYRLAGQAMNFETRAMAALLHCGPATFLDGTTAGAVHGLRAMPRSLIQATQVGRITRAMPSWIRVSSAARVLDGDVVDRGPFRLAHPLRMLLKLAGQFNLHRFERAAEDAWHRGLVSPSEMAAYLEMVRRPGLQGVALLDTWLAKALPRPRPSQSGLEMDTLTAVRLVGLPEPVRQHPLVLQNGELIHLDIAWPDVTLAVEPGHSWWHGGDLRMSADYARDLACGEVGWHVVRFDQAMQADLVKAGQSIRNTYEARRATFQA